MFDAKKGEFDGVVERAVRRGELPTGSTATLLEEVIPALIMTRAVIQGQPADEKFAIHVVDDIVLPMLHP